MKFFLLAFMVLVGCTSTVATPYLVSFTTYPAGENTLVSLEIKTQQVAVVKVRFTGDNVTNISCSNEVPLQSLLCLMAVTPSQSIYHLKFGGIVKSINTISDK
jgi:hypothetical protein